MFAVTIALATWVTPSAGTVEDTRFSNLPVVKPVAEISKALCVVKASAVISKTLAVMFRASTWIACWSVSALSTINAVPAASLGETILTLPPTSKVAAGTAVFNPTLLVLASINIIFAFALLSILKLMSWLSSLNTVSKLSLSAPWRRILLLVPATNAEISNSASSVPSVLSNIFVVIST